MGQSRLAIRSRFAQEDKEDYFLHYMLQKVFSINLFDLPHNVSRENIFDFLPLLFSHYLNKAVAQGVYKEYQKNIYNDANVRGNIDVNSHLRQNFPFLGKIAYRVREHSYDNKITQLARHTIEFVKSHRFGYVLLQDKLIRDSVKQIELATPSYDSHHRQEVINQNLRPLVHPYFEQYKFLQKICLQILRHDSLKYGADDDKIYGLLFDGAWLWEEYLNTILADCGFAHPENKNSKGGIHLIVEPRKRFVRYPDFYKEDFVLDAKYKRMENGKGEMVVSREDMNQIVSYLYMLRANFGGFIHPAKQTQTQMQEIGKLNGYGGIVKKWSLAIPQAASSFTNFCFMMAEVEEEVKRLV